SLESRMTHPLTNARKRVRAAFYPGWLAVSSDVGDAIVRSTSFRQPRIAGCDSPPTGHGLLSATLVPVQAFR
ncbi:MAG: hypothetical protein ACE5F6_04755, partial [Anaerolineae bacterium]